MKIEDGMLVMEHRDCRRCYGRGEVTTRKTCPTCNGTRRGPRGGRNGCKVCFDGTVVDTENMVVCPKCDGEPKDAELETPFDHIEWSTIREHVPLVIFRADRPITFNESLLGIGTVYSVVDYGEASRMTDEQLAKKIDERGSTEQGTKFIRNKNDLRLCSFIGVYVSTGGYSVRAGFDDLDPQDVIAIERPYDEGMAVGMAVYAAGGHGTFAGVYRTEGEA